jgi:hypothetical protein
MPTLDQINAAKLELIPQPYDGAVSVMSADNQKVLFYFLRKFLFETKQAGRYNKVPDKISAAVGIDAAFLQAVLNNVSDEGSKKAQLNGELTYLTQDTINNELQLAINAMYEPIGIATLGTKVSEAATAIRAEYGNTLPLYACCHSCGYQRCRC